MNSILASTKILAEEKGAEIIFEEEPPVYVWADEYMIEEVFTNYLTNAIHYVRKDGVIRISFKPMGNDIRVCVYNQGDWIAEEDIGRVFEKFYKADKARTREYGGNGIFTSKSSSLILFAALDIRLIGAAKILLNNSIKDVPNTISPIQI